MANREKKLKEFSPPERGGGKERKMKNYKNTQIRKALKWIGADRVRQRADGTWEALWHAHPRNDAANGRYLLIGRNNEEAATYLMGYTCDEDLFKRF